MGEGLHQCGSKVVQAKAEAGIVEVDQRYRTSVHQHVFAQDIGMDQTLVARDALRERLAGDQGLIHADVLRENVLVNGRSVSLIDFDDSGLGFRLHDLGTALVQTFAHPEQPQIRAALMDGYGTT
ncbi:MAG: hypothetical protein EON48_01560, partial [Acetobacteraceae bacterium]